MTPKTEVHLITPVTTVGIRDLKEVEHLTGPNFVITNSILEKGPPSIECELDEALAVPDTVKRAIEAQNSGAHAAIIDCMGDPGMNAAREAVKIPVLGPGQSSMLLATMLGQSFSIVTVLDSVRPMLVNNARVYGVYEKLTSVRVVNIPVLELESRMDEAKKLLAEQALEAVETEGASVIVLGCTGFLGCADAIKALLNSKGHPVPVIDPIPATVCLAEALVKAGLAHSKATYETPRDKEFKGYDIPKMN